MGTSHKHDRDSELFRIGWVLSKRFSKIASSMTQMTRKGVKFDWTKECEGSFQELKKRLTLA
jgi:hypothetical protein